MNAENERLLKNAKDIMSRLVPARPVGDLEYPRQRVQSQKEQADASAQRRATEAADASGQEDDICPTCGDLRSRCTGDQEEPFICPACGGEVFLLGRLGNRIHARCRYCGLDQSIEVR